MGSERTSIYRRCAASELGSVVGQELVAVRKHHSLDERDGLVDPVCGPPSAMPEVAQSERRVQH